MTKNFKCRSLALAVITILWGGTCGAIASAEAATPLNQATIQALRNSVQLFVRERSARPAKVKDKIVAGDTVKTDRAAMVELQFNDRSLARIGELALFQFLPNTRTFNLSNGTMVLLIPPGRGRTQIRTPNAAAGIRGSALFVRYIPETDTTIVGALTNSGIEISNQDASQRQELQAGQLAVVVQDRIEKIYTFDLKTFYETSDLVKGLELQSRKGIIQDADAPISQVRAETSEAIERQTTPLNSDVATVIQNPSFLRRPAKNLNETTFTERATTGRAKIEPVGDRSTNRPGSLPTPQPFERSIVPPILPSVLSPGLTFPISPAATTSPGQPGVLTETVGTGRTAIGGSSGRSVTPSGSAGGRTIIPPGLSGNNPGRSGGTQGPPGQTGTAPGQIRNNFNPETP